MEPMISIVIPAYNEEGRILPSLKRIVDYMDSKEWSYEIILVDDGSGDGTIDKAKTAGNIKILENRKNMGKGFSVRKGMLEARGEYILFTDADLSVPIEALEGFMDWLRDYDVVIGSRNIEGASITARQSFFRNFLGKTFALIVRSLMQLNLKDTQCGFKLFKAQAAKSIFPLQRVYGFSFDVEILYIALRKGFKVKELPVKWNNDPRTKVNAIKDSVLMLFDVLKITVNSCIGKY